MSEFTTAFVLAGKLLITQNPALLEIILLSLRVSGGAVLIGCLIGLPTGAAIGMFRFPGRELMVVISNTLLGLPPVVVGLVVYLLLSRSGPLGWLDLLYSPAAMIAAQVILVTPIIVALTRQVTEDLNREYDEQLRSLGVGAGGRLRTLLYEGRHALSTAVLAAFGRAIAEVGAVIIVGGNIAHQTRVMTTAIALETSRGELGMAIALGILLLALALLVNGTVSALNRRNRHLHGG